eukprot:403337413
MMLNKLDFESGLKQDKSNFKPDQLLINAPITSGKPNLFGPTPNLASGGYAPSQFENRQGSAQGGSQNQMEGKSKRDLLWEQKRKQKQDIINPPIMKDEGNSAGFLDQMNPASRQKLVMPQNRNENNFQKAIVFEQPKALIEMPQNIQNQQPRGMTPQNIDFPKSLPPPQIQNSFSDPQDYGNQFEYRQPIKQESAGIWNQVQQNVNEHIPKQNFSQFNDPYFNQQPQNMNIDNNFSQKSLQNQFVLPNNQNNFNNVPPMHDQFSQMNMNQFSQQPMTQNDYPIANSNRNMPQQHQNLQQQQNQAQSNQVQQQRLNQEEKKKREKEDRIKREREELQKNMNYNPFGRGGSGAPVKDTQGNIMAQRRPMNDNYQQNNQMQQRGTPQMMPNYQPLNMPPQQMMNDPYAMQGMQNMQPPFQNQNQFQPQGMMLGQPIVQQQFMGYGNDIPPMQMIQPTILPAQQIQLPNQFQAPLPLPSPQQFSMQNDFGISPGIGMIGQGIQNQSPFQNQGNSKLRAPDPAMQYLSGNNDTFKDNSKFSQKDQAPPSTEVNQGLGIGGFGEFQKDREKDQKKELNNVLRQQMEEQKRRKEEEVRKKKEEEAREEDRIRRERQKIEEEYKMEENKKKSKFNEIQQANAQAVQNKGAEKKKNIVQMDDGPMQNYVVDKGNQKLDLFGNGGPVIQSQELVNNNMDQFQMQQPPQMQPNPAISQTRIISEISNELKSNFIEEIGKLRNEMNSQQRAFREQLERLKVETNQSNDQKSQALTEIEKVKNEIRAQRETERLQELKLMNALEKHNPNRIVPPMEVLQNYDKPGSFPSQNKQPPIKQSSLPTQMKQDNSFSQPYQNQETFNGIQMNSSFYNNQQKRPGGSRQDSRDSQRRKEINNYEKMFFNNMNNGPSSLPQKSQSQSRDQKRPEYNLKEEKLVSFNQDYFNPDVKSLNPYEQPGKFNAPRHEPKIMKRGESQIQTVQQIDFGASLDGQSNFMPIGGPLGIGGNNFTENPQKGGQFQNNNNFNPPIQGKENKQSNGLNYMNQLKDMGAGNIRLDTEGAEDTMDFVERIMNGGEKKKPAEKKQDERLADKFDGNFDFNLPQIPAYEGIQNDYIKKESKPQQNQFNSIPQNNLKNESPDIFAKGLGAYAYGGNNPTGQSLDGTMNTIGTLNSINLDNLNKKNEDRMAKLGLAYDSLEMTQNTQVNYGEPKNINKNDKGYSNPFNEPTSYKPQVQDSSDLKNFDNILFDLIKSDKTQDPNRGGSQSGKIPHLNQRNSQANMQYMRDTRDQFMAPKLGHIDEDGGEDFEGTFKAYKPKNQESNYNSKNDAFKMPTDIRRYDSFLDNNDLALD